jgi:RNA polymerase sigma-70 factor (ECF subfamily)
VTDDAVRAALASGEVARATTLTLQAYGREVYGFVRALARDDDLAAEAFAMLGEDLWRGLAKFRWESSLRSWTYTLGRHALHRLHRDPRRRARNNVALSDAPELGEQVRSLTADYRKSEVKDELRELREQLDPGDHELLLLRIDRAMSWKDIARIRGGDDDVTARAAALRKRFERVKTRLRTLAEQRGLLKPE